MSAGIRARACVMPRAGVILRAGRELRARAAPRAPVTRAAAVVAAVLALSACAVGPEHRSPLPSAPAQHAFAGADASEYTAEAPPGRWWRLYDDEPLNGIVRTALEANTDLRVAAANLERAEARLSGVRGGRLPDTTLRASSTSGQQNVVGSVPSASFEDTIYEIGLDVSYQADLLGRVSRAIESAEASAEAVQAAYDGTRITVAAETARAYARACAAGLELDVARRSVELQQQNVDLTERLLEAGRGTGLDVARANAQLEQRRAAIPTLEARRRAALYRLAVLMGRPPAEYPSQAAECATPPTLEQTIPVGDGASLLERRPDVRRAERELAVATADVGVATAELYPNVTIGASAGAIALSPDGLDDSDASQWSLGPLVSWTFPNRRSARAQLAQAEADADAALASFEGTWLEALEETEAALADYANELDRRDALENARAQSAEAARLATVRFEAGRVSFLDVLQAEITLADAQMALARSRARVAELQIALFLALGGGWGAE